ncbi:glycosyltransferase involved in cell wall biosynthesis [Pontibacter aydingkolensis]|uniref:Glycosyltransferase family 4 protein n=1 Tax=Pontibacter aydingkolensis TaxID=1911536 RepID=A0ABS7CUN9_9BACT|nr:glycosyltransferase family 4 protein [Pontibacter aydingkolensis]MBW7467202.1 glycosyltransferase family 4 protein [Pontibacter aydingkolensis]
MEKNKTLLVSADYRLASGGISRVAHLINQAIPNELIFSLHGNKNLSNGREHYFGNNRFVFLTRLLLKIIFSKFDIIIFDHLGVASALLLVPKFLLKKVIIFLHDEEAWVEIKGRNRAALTKADILLTNSQFTFDHFTSKNPFFKAKTKVCLLGGVPEKFEIEPDAPSKEFSTWFLSEKPYLIFVSRLWKKHSYKGYWELLRAYEKLKTFSDFNLRLAIIGRGDDATHVQEFIVKNDFDDRVQIFTNVTDNDLAFFYKNSAGLVFPSTREGFGLVFLEAMFFKKASIGIVNQPAEEIIIHNKTGLLLQDNSPDTLATTLLFLNEDLERLSVWGENAYKLYESKFSKQAFIDRFIENIS